MDKQVIEALGNNTRNMIEKIANHPTLKNILQQFPNDGNEGDKRQDPKVIQAALAAAQSSTGKWIQELSSMANVVVGRCARLVGVITPTF